MPANHLSSYDSPRHTGVSHEDLDDIAYDISPEETPVFTAAKKGKTKATRQDWPTDALGAPSPNGKVEGRTVTATSPDAPTRIGNVTQINDRDVTLTATSQEVEASDDWGHEDRETARRLQELKRDVEAALIRMQPLVAGSEGVARQTRSIPHFIPQTNAVGYTVPASETAAVGAFAGGAAFNYAAFQSAMQQAYEVGGRPKHAYVSPDNKATVATFVGRVNEVLNVSQKTIVHDVTVVETPHGKVDVIIDQFYPAGDTNSDFTLLLDPQYYGVNFLRPFRKTKMGKVGDADAWLVNCEWLVKVHSPSAHACIGYDAVP